MSVLVVLKERARGPLYNWRQCTHGVWWAIRKPVPILVAALAHKCTVLDILEWMACIWKLNECDASREMLNVNSASCSPMLVAFCQISSLCSRLAVCGLSEPYLVQQQTVFHAISDRQSVRLPCDLRIGTYISSCVWEALHEYQMALKISNNARLHSTMLHSPQAQFPLHHRSVAEKSWSTS